MKLPDKRTEVFLWGDENILRAGMVAQLFEQRNNYGRAVFKVMTDSTETLSVQPVTTAPQPPSA